MMWIVYVLLGLLGLIVLLLGIAVLRTLLAGHKVSSYQPDPDPARAERYAQALSRMVRYETVSVPGENQREKFLGFHQLLAELFPLVHANLEKTELDGNLLFYWKGKRSEKPIVLMSHHHHALQRRGHGPVGAHHPHLLQRGGLRHPQDHSR